MVESEVVSDQRTLLNLWKHECTRVISDRFISPADKEWFEKAVHIVAEEDLGAELAALVHAEPYFVDFLRDAPEMTGKFTSFFVFLIFSLLFHSLFFLCSPYLPLFFFFLLPHIFSCD